MTDEKRKVRAALVSVSDKTGVVEFVRGLVDADVKILSTGGTAKALRDAGIEVTDVSEHTGSPEILDGRVKTLHPKVHGGILARRDDASHTDQVAQHGIEYIDLVCVNLYPFEEVTKRGCSFSEAIENIDIGGPSMLRSAAKNHADVAVVVDPADYDLVLAEIRGQGTVSAELRERLAFTAFRATAAYDGMISDYLGARAGRPAAEEGATQDGEESASSGDAGTLQFGRSVHHQWSLVQTLRYGENPHQKAAFYRAGSVEGPSIATAAVLAGKELSFNNIVDADAALQLIMEFAEPACVAIKHTNPCGAATAATASEAFTKARACDPVSIFGGIVALNRELDLATAEAMQDVFLEVVLAPAFAQEALQLFAATKKLRNVRLLRVDLAEAGGRLPAGADAPDLKRVLGGLLVQDRDLDETSVAGSTSVAKRAPTAEEVSALEFAWKICKHVKSNAIVLAREDRLVGVGAGQMSRVDSARIAVMRAQEHGHDTTGCVVASDAFFPFRDGLDVCAEAGATAVVQPGGSVRDSEIVEAADERAMAMLMTGVRHFRH